MNLKFGIMGAGAIGGYLGVRLSAAGYPVTMIGRPSLIARKNTMSATNLDGYTVSPGQGFVVSTDPHDLADVDICLLTVKGRSTTEAAQTLAKVLRPNIPVVSFQNGIQNVARIEAALSQPVFGGMVTFNVVGQEGALSKGTSGPLMFGQSKALDPLANAFRKAGEPFERRFDMLAVQRGKLLLNLNNGVCAATGLSILHSIQNPVTRRVFSQCISEGARAMKALGQPYVRIEYLSPDLIGKILRLPNFFLLRIAKKMMTIDPQARSSTLQDLDRGVPTEIDDLNGQIVQLAKQAGTSAPANQAIYEQVKYLEKSPGEFLSPEELYAKSSL
ncbi:MAG: 2-dehydropantoate 2-reductase [Myxococcota bacterium]|nr:2-dehydropantoate 2-reductase [Myxococcota bacterium]